MRRVVLGAALAAVCFIAVAAPATADRRHPLNAYRVAVTGKNLSTLAKSGFDVIEGRRNGRIEIHATAGQIRKLARSGVKARLVRDRAGRTTAQRSARVVGRAFRKARRAQADPYTGSDAAYKVWRRYDRVAGDRKEQYLELYDRVADLPIAKQMSIGKSDMGRDIMAVRVTKDAKATPDGSRPAVLYNAIQHSREWLAGETCRRTLLWFTEQYGVNAQVTRLVDTRELWFVCIANPDGYEYSFTPGNRLWRKNMADNDGDGIRGENGDGVDPNRNFPVNWGLDDEGSSPAPASETYRGPEPASEPETRAMMWLFEHVDFAFQKNDHTAASLILYPQGWQQYTPALDDPIFTALAGSDAKPAINGYDPDLGAELYITNGDTNDTAYNDLGILSYTPEGTPARDLSVSGFEYEDSEGAVEAEFKRHREFALDLAESAANPASPKSHLKNTTQDFYVDAFPESWGDPQTVQVLAKRSLGELVLRFKVNGGATQTAPTAAWAGGQDYDEEKGRYYHRVRGQIAGKTQPGDSVEVWFAEKVGGRRSASFTYRAVKETPNPVLVMSAEDYTGPTPAQTGGPRYAQKYLDALTSIGVGADLYDVDARGRRAPDVLGVLSHYRTVIWDTGDDYLTREPGQVPGTGISRLAIEELIAARDFVNEGGKLVYAGKHAGQQYAEGFEFRNFGYPQPNEDSAQGRWCDGEQDEARDGCIPAVDDFLQYTLGAYLRADNGAAYDEDTGAVAALRGVGGFGPGPWSFAADPVLTNAGAPTATFAVTSSLLKSHPAFADSKPLAEWDRGEAGPYSPYTGDYYMATNHDDEAYKRLSTEVTVPASGTATLRFKASYDLEPAWDFLFVEAAPTGTSNWTTLPSPGETTTDTGDSCWVDGGWWQLHPRLRSYQTVSGEGCVPTGTTGSWNAASGNSGGWQQWEVDLSQYAGQTVEVAIVVATDWAVGNLGAWVDDAEVTVNGTTTSTSFESDTAPFEVNALEESPSDATWVRSKQVFAEGAVVGTDDTVYAGFEPATMSTGGELADFLKSALTHLAATP